MATCGTVKHSTTNSKAAAAPTIMPCMPVVMKFMSILYQTLRVK